MKLNILSIEKNYLHVLEYIYYLEKDNIDDIKYTDEIIYKNYRFGGMKYKSNKRKVVIPDIYNSLNIHFNNSIIKSSHISDLNKDVVKKTEKLCLVPHGCGNIKQIPLIKLTLECDSYDILIDFIDKSKEYNDKFSKELIKQSDDTTRVYCYHDYWSLFSKIPNRNNDTLYLPKGTYESIHEDIYDFFSEKTRNEYINYGIPYKKTYLLYGKPGCGKTSTINCIASDFNCDIFILPLSNEITDTCFIDAISGIYRSDGDDNESNKKILVLEDIDCLFEDRKSGDSNKSNLSLQNLLNCLDGFTTLDGTITIITANNVNALDDAMVRSCRIDKSINYDYADKFQTFNIFNKYIIDEVIIKKLYNFIKNKQYTIAMLQQFLFEYRNNQDDIVNNFQYLNDIIDHKIKSHKSTLYS